MSESLQVKQLINTAHKACILQYSTQNLYPSIQHTKSVSFNAAHKVFILQYSKQSLCLNCTAHKSCNHNYQVPTSILPQVVMFPDPRPDWQRRWEPFFLAHKFLPENHQPSSKVVMFPEPRTDPFFLTNEFIPESPSHEERPTETENRNSEGTEKENRNKIDMDSVVPYPNLNCIC